MQRREIILLDETPELQDGTEESATKRQRTSRKSSQAQHPKNPRSEVTTLTRSRKSEASGRPGSEVNTETTTSTRSLRLEGIDVQATPKLRSSQAEDSGSAAFSSFE